MTVPVRPAVSAAVIGPRHEGEKICHLVEWEEPDLALCGKNVTGFPWDPPWPYCVVCIDIASRQPDWRPFFDGTSWLRT